MDKLREISLKNNIYCYYAISSWCNLNNYYVGDVMCVIMRFLLRAGLHIYRTDIYNVKLSGCDFSCCDLRGVNFCGADLSGCNFGCANLNDCDFSCADLRGATFRYASAEFADFRYAMLRGANFTEIHAVNAKFAGCGERAFSRAFRACFDFADFSGMNLRKCVLDMSSFKRANLENTDLTGASVYMVKFDYANLRGTIFTGTCIEYAETSRCNLRKSILIGCNEDFVKDRFYEDDYEI